MIKEKFKFRMIFNKIKSIFEKFISPIINKIFLFNRSTIYLRNAVVEPYLVE